MVMETMTNNASGFGGSFKQSAADKKLYQDELRRQMQLMKMKKWDVFRQQKAQYLEFATDLVKKRNKIKRWII